MSSAFDSAPGLSLTPLSLGPCAYESPACEMLAGQGQSPRFVRDDERILLDDRVWAVTDAAKAPSLEVAGPRQRIFFPPPPTGDIGIGVVTCGGLCPGLNDVIRGLVMEAWHRYGVRRIYGFRYGYQGLVAAHSVPPMELTPDVVSDIHERGGTLLGSSRGEQSPVDIVDTLQRRRIHILFTIGGDGTQRGAMDIVREIARRQLQIAVVGVPKTIDNDLSFLDRSFGFETAYSEAVEAIRCAHNESKGCLNGIGLVKLMGRHSGFLAAHATLATSHVNFCLIPEVPFTMGAFLEALKLRLQRKHHAVIVVAEGAAQDLAGARSAATDASGNARLTDIGQFLAAEIRHYLDSHGGDHGGSRGGGMDYNLKYIDPAYIVRSVPAVPSDKVYCWRLAQNAVHAAMAGRTGLVVGRWHGRMVHVPIEAAVSTRNTVDPDGELWMSVLEATGQPPVME